MLSIAWMLFVAWFLNLFGFGNMIITGLSQLGGPEIGMIGYYFIFAVAGLIKNVLSCASSNRTVIELSNELKDILK